MRSKDAAGHWLPRLTSRQRGVPTRAQAGVGTGTTRTRTQPKQTERKRTEQKRTALSEAFHAQTSPYLEAVYADALCLTGSREGAADLVVAAYLRAFQECQQEGDGHVPPRRRTQGTLAWLYSSLHAVFCKGILERVARDASPIGGER